MPFFIVRNDITKMECDAIVNAANTSLCGGGGVDGAIHLAAGEELLKECRTLGGCKTGEAKVTGGYRLPCKYIIHTVGPVWSGGGASEDTLLRSCYSESLRIAAEKNCASVAFPLISAGAYGYPRDEAIRVATDTIKEFLVSHDEMTVYLVVYNSETVRCIREKFGKIEELIDDAYALAHEDTRNRAVFASSPKPEPKPESKPKKHNLFGKKRHASESPDFSALISPQKEEQDSAPTPPPTTTLAATPAPAAPHDEWDECAPVAAALMPEQEAPTAAVGMSLEDLLRRPDESFSEMLLRKIDESGMTDAQCYKKANVDRKLFSKIRSDPHYKPSKPTVIAFAVALELNIDETNDILRRAGFALSPSSKFDIIIEYFIRNGNYDIYEINEALFAFDQVLLGA